MTKSTQLTKEIICLEFDTPIQIYDYFNSNQIEIISEMLKAIEFAIKHKLTRVDFFELKPINSKQRIVLTIQEKNWLFRLNELMDFCISKEYYELAAEARNLLTQIKIEKT